jgi:hypothetical protein
MMEKIQNGLKFDQNVRGKDIKSNAAALDNAK